jgi:Ca-activated chloride channel homolog
MWLEAELRALAAGDVALEHPLRLVAALGALALWLALALRRGPLRIAVPAFAGAKTLDVAALVSFALRACAFVALGVALAGPIGFVPARAASGSGVDLVIALDASGSMEALDGMLAGQRATRLALAKSAVADLVKRRPRDRLGLIVFGDRAFTQCPLTLDHALLLAALERVEVGVAGDATALGDAFGLAIRRFAASGAASTRRVVVLLTDGRHNAGQLAPATAARIALREGVRAHAVGIGSSGAVPFAGRGTGEPLRFEKVDLDRETLQEIARTTGGRFFHARRPEDLAQVADLIDALETSPPEDPGSLRRASLLPLAIVVALALLGLDALLAAGPLRRIP